MSGIPLSRLVALGFVATLAVAGPAAAEKWIPAKGDPDASCAPAGRCGKVRLPDGIVLWGGCWLVARHGQAEATVANLDPSRGEMGSCGALRGVALHEDGSVVVEDQWGRKVTIRRAHLHSRLELAEARRLARKKRPHQAEQALARALALDPGYEDAAFELARIRLGLGKAEQAAAALSPFVGKEALRIYARVLSMHALRPLLDQAPFAAVRAKQAGTAAIAGPRASLIAFAAERALFAMVQRRAIFSALCGPCFETNLVVFDAAGRLHAVLPLLTETPSTDQDREQAALPGRVKQANRFLADVGFVAMTDIERVTFERRPTGSQAARFPKARFGIAFRDGMARVLRGDRVLHERRVHDGCTGPHGDKAHLCLYDGSASWAAWIPARNMLLLEWGTSGAEGNDVVTSIEVWPLGGALGGRVIMPPGADFP